MNVFKVKNAAAGIVFAALTVAAANSAAASDTSLDVQYPDCKGQTNCSVGQRPIPPYVINPYQVFHSEEDGVHYFKGGSGLGYGYPYYDSPQAEYSDTKYFVSYPESSIDLIQPQFFNMDRPDRKHFRRHRLDDRFSKLGVNLPSGNGLKNYALKPRKLMNLTIGKDSPL